MHSLTRLAFLLVLVIYLAALSWTQTSTASLRGIVSDAKGAVLPGAVLTLTDPYTGTSRSTKTDATGSYQFLQLPPASYSLSISAVGFATIKQDNIPLLVDTPTRLNFTLQVEGLATSVEVVGENVLVNTQDATLGHPFDVQQIDSLPFEGRDPAAIKPSARSCLRWQQ